MKPKLVILRGNPAAGKSTAYANLRKRNEMKDWLFVDHCAMKNWFGKDLGKKSLFAILKVVMPSQKNIIIEEMSRETIMKFLKSYIKRYNYKIIVFQFEVDLKKAKKRDIQRVVDKKHYQKKILKNIEEIHNMHNERFDYKGTIVDTNKLSKIQVVDFILDKLK